MTQHNTDIFSDIQHFYDKIELSTSASEAYWDNVADEMERIAAKYSNERIVLELLITCYSAAARHAKGIA